MCMCVYKMHEPKITKYLPLAPTGQMTKFLVIRFSSIGDIVLTSPVIRHLKEQVFEGAEVHYLTKKRYASILEENPHLDKIYTIEKSTAEVREQLAEEQYHYIIDLHRNIRSKMVKRHTKVLSFDLDKLNWKKWLWVNFEINQMPDKHIVDRYMDTISSFGIQNDSKGLEYFIPKEIELKTEERIKQEFTSEYLVWVLSATHEGKKFSPEKLKRTIAHIKHPIILIGGSEDSMLGKTLSQERDHVFNQCGATSIHESAALIKRSKFVVTPDTGMMHIASAFKKDIISYWGCTHPGLGMSPYMPGARTVIIQPNERSKRPCSKLGNRCKYGKNARCPEVIPDNVIVETVNKFWREL